MAAHPLAEFDIVNNTNATITAWKIGINVRRSDGSTERVTTSTDAYVEFAGVVPGTGAVGYPYSTIRGFVTIDKAKPDIQDMTAVLL